jgi:Fic family protein
MAMSNQPALFATPELDALEREVIARIDDLRGKLRYAVAAPKRWTGLLRRATLARSIQGSNLIEGYHVTLDDAIAAIEHGEPLEANDEVWQAITGYRNAMTYILQLSDDPHFSFNEGLIRSLHYMMLHHELAKNPGKWRPGPIFVRRDPAGDIVYEGPSDELVPGLMHELVDRLNAKESTPPMIRAAMGHLNLVMIHPFSDGNGRMARAIQTLVLAREGIVAKEFCSIEEYLGRYQQEYCAVLGDVGAGQWHPERDARPWVRFCLRAHYRQASRLLRRTREVKRLWDEIEIEIKRRGLPERTISAVAEAAMGGRVRNSTYRPVAEVSDHTASRDLKLLVDQGLLLPDGEKRGRSYIASPQVREIRSRTRDREPRVDEDPFERNLAPRPR